MRKVFPNYLAEKSVRIVRPTTHNDTHVERNVFSDQPVKRDINDNKLFYKTSSRMTMNNVNQDCINNKKKVKKRFLKRK